MKILNKKFYVSDFEITVREIIVSICIFVFMMLFGMSCSANISEAEIENNEKYTKALRIEDTDLFQHGMNTNVGNAFVYGTLKAIDTVSFPEIDGEYMYVKKIEEWYERHEKWVEEEDEDGNITKRLEVWYEWDIKNSESSHSNELSFNDVAFSYDKFNLNKLNSIHIETIAGDKTYSWYSGEYVKVRYMYYGIETEFTGTIFTDLRDKTISDNTYFYNNMNIEQTVDYVMNKGGEIIFWIFWIPITVILILLFYVADNKWLK